MMMLKMRTELVKVKNQDSGTRSMYKRLQGWAFIILFFFDASAAWAQTASLPTPETKLVDENNVNLASGTVRFDIADVSIGPKDRKLSDVVSSANSQFFPNSWLMNNYTIQGYTDTSLWLGSYGGAMYFGSDTEKNKRFPDGTSRTVVRSGSTMEVVGSTAVYTKGDGTRYITEPGVTSTSIGGYVDKIVHPDGVVEKLNYNTSGVYRRLASVVRSDGLMLKYAYADDASPGSTAWQTRTKVTAINLAKEYCNPIAPCSPGLTWPKAEYSSNASATIPGGKEFIIKEMSGTDHKFTMNEWGDIVGYRSPSYATSDNRTFQHCSRGPTYDCYVMTCGVGAGSCVSTPITGKIVKSTRYGRNWIYGYTPSIAGHYWEYHSSGPDGEFRSVQGSTDYAAILSFSGGAAGEATFAVDVDNIILREKTQTRPGEHFYTYDARGNVTRDEVTTGTGTNVADTAEYPATCVYRPTCNKPVWTKDRNGNQTDYEYDPVHGGLLSVTRPAVNGIRPKSRYSYIQRYARFLNASGGLDQSEQPIWLLASESSCKTGATVGNGCAIAGDEVVTTYEYGSDTGPNNLWLRGVAVSDGSTTLRTCFAYDNYGNITETTKPSANLGVCP